MTAARAPNQVEHLDIISKWKQLDGPGDDRRP
jgi:hypothetical protein